MPFEARLVRQPGDRRAVALLDVLTDLADAWPAMQATMYRRLTAAPALSCSAVVSRLGVQLPATTTKPSIIAVSVEVMCECLDDSGIRWFSVRFTWRKTSSNRLLACFKGAKRSYVFIISYFPTLRHMRGLMVLYYVACLSCCV